MAKVYLAGPYETWTDMQHRARDLGKHGHEVTCNWISGKNAKHDKSITDNSVRPDRAAKWAEQDLIDIQEADAIIFFSGGSGRGGRHVELGIAIGINKTIRQSSYTYVREKKIIIVGRRENIFHYLPEIYVAETFEEAIKLL